MKFALVEPPEDPLPTPHEPTGNPLGDGAGVRPPAPTPHETSHPGKGPVNASRNRALDDVRASLNQLREHVAKQHMADIGQEFSPDLLGEENAVFRPEKFTPAAPEESP